jgi:hypothetical protein
MVNSYGPSTRSWLAKLTMDLKDHSPIELNMGEGIMVNFKLKRRTNKPMLSPTTFLSR